MSNGRLIPRHMPGYVILPRPGLRSLGPQKPTSDLLSLRNSCGSRRDRRSASLVKMLQTASLGWLYREGKFTVESSFSPSHSVSRSSKHLLFTPGIRRRSLRSCGAGRQGRLPRKIPSAFDLTMLQGARGLRTTYSARAGGGGRRCFC